MFADLDKNMVAFVFLLFSWPFDKHFCLETCLLASQRVYVCVATLECGPSMKDAVPVLTQR